jgi:hypothetical protein
MYLAVVSCPLPLDGGGLGRGCDARSILVASLHYGAFPPPKSSTSASNDVVLKRKPMRPQRQPLSTREGKQQRERIKAEKKNGAGPSSARRKEKRRGTKECAPKRKRRAVGGGHCAPRDGAVKAPYGGRGGYFSAVCAGIATGSRVCSGVGSQPTACMLAPTG